MEKIKTITRILYPIGFLISGLIWFHFQSLAKESLAVNSDEALSTWNQVISAYRSKNSIIMNVKKTFTQKLLNKKKESTGRFYLANKKWRWDIFSPEKSHILYDGKTLTLNRPNESYSIPSSKVAVLSLLFDPLKFDQTFQYQEQKRKGRTTIYTFRGLKPQAPEKIFVKIEKDYILSLQIEWGELMGREHYQFSSIQFDQKIPKNLLP